MSTHTAESLRAMRKRAKKVGKRLMVWLDGHGAEVLALTKFAMPYGCPAFRCVNGAGWYPLNGAPFQFTVQN